MLELRLTQVNIYKVTEWRKGQSLCLLMKPSVLIVAAEENTRRHFFDSLSDGPSNSVSLSPGSTAKLYEVSGIESLKGLSLSAPFCYLFVLPTAVQTTIQSYEKQVEVFFQRIVRPFYLVGSELKSKESVFVINSELPRKKAEELVNGHFGVLLSGKLTDPQFMASVRRILTLKLNSAVTREKYGLKGDEQHFSVNESVLSSKQQPLKGQLNNSSQQLQQLDVREEEYINRKSLVLSEFIEPILFKKKYNSIHPNIAENNEFPSIESSVLNGIYARQNVPQKGQENAIDDLVRQFSSQPNSVAVEENRDLKRLAALLDKVTDSEQQSSESRLLRELEQDFKPERMNVKRQVPSESFVEEFAKNQTSDNEQATTPVELTKPSSELDSNFNIDEGRPLMIVFINDVKVPVHFGDDSTKIVQRYLKHTREYFSAHRIKKLELIVRGAINKKIELTVRNRQSAIKVKSPVTRPLVPVSELRQQQSQKPKVDYLTLNDQKYKALPSEQFKQQKDPFEEVPVVIQRKSFDVNIKPTDDPVSKAVEIIESRKIPVVHFDKIVEKIKEIQRTRKP